MSGNHPERPSSITSAYPTAHGIIRSILDNDARPADISPSGELYRAIERFHAGREAAPSQQPALPRSSAIRWTSGPSTPSNMSSDDNSDPQRRLPRDSRLSHLLDNLRSSPVLPPLRSLSNRRVTALSGSNSPTAALARSLQSDRATNRLFSAMEAWTEPGDTAVDSWDREWPDEEDTQDGTRGFGIPVSLLGHSPEHGRGDSDMSPLRRLIDFTHATPPDIPDLFSGLPLQSPEEQTEEHRRVKRRKVDSDRLVPHFQGFQDGKYGQVQPGQLKMELVSCDGGVMDSEDSAKYAAENILKNDQSVYCTGNPRCNIVLRHQGATVFTLKELIIKAPKSNFCSPVQAGLVFVSMAQDHLLNRTAQYQIQYTTPTLTPRSSSRREGQRHGAIISIRHNDDGSTMTQAQQRARRLVNIGRDDEDNENLRIAQIPPEFNISSPHFHVSTEHSDDDDEDDEEDDVNSRPIGVPPRYLPAHAYTSDSDNGELDDEDRVQRQRRLRTSQRWRARRQQRREAERQSDARRELTEAAEAAQIATQEAVRAVGGELMIPHARFHFDRPQSSWTIRFDPPISGRFILLKMWNPYRQENANIDIQAVIAKGYAGPRFFPAVELL
ncbi:hypothetical protein F5Y16DRAFT_16262 [Xylariaceae sp. FL0255]|nr:hypothetical protein F5Y16DRAFT_16262 [Xylariaceae sp. FL0255]